MKKLVWKKGDFTITPYGYLWAAMAYETERTNNGDYTFYVFSAQDQGEPTFHVDAKSTRIGFDVLGPRIACLNCAQSGGKVEFDFQGTLSPENKGSVLLRHAYWEVKDEEFRLLAGQTWDVISPLISRLDHVFGLLGCGQHRLSPGTVPRRTIHCIFR